MKRPKHSDDPFEVRVRDTSGHKALHARRGFEPGDRIVRFGARRTMAMPSVHTVQVSATEHILLDPELLQYTNHSCNPNVIFDCEQMVVAAIKRILPGDEIVYFYPSTEASMHQPFACDCDSDQCLGIVRGAEHLSTAVLENYHLAAHIQALLAERDQAAA